MKVAIIGSGNMANFLAKRISKFTEIVAVYSRNKSTCERFAKKWGFPYKTIEEIIHLRTDIIVLAVNDDSISELAYRLSPSKALKVHCSGSTPLSVLSLSNRHAAVVWPLISISEKSRIPQNPPVCIEASNEKTLKQVFTFARYISNNVYVYNSEQRLVLHLLAVMCNNFTNHLYHIAWQTARENNVDFDLLQPITLQTVRNILLKPPGELQTGPAKRNDKHTMERHLMLLKNNMHKEIYSILSADIFHTYNTPMKEKRK